MSRCEIVTTHPEIPDGAYAQVREGESGLNAVIRSIERRTGSMCYTKRHDSWSESTDTYQTTFVNPKSFRGGGYSVVCECRIYVMRGCDD